MSNVYTAWDPANKGANVTLSGGNLTASLASFTSGSVLSVIGKSAGKWYWEVKLNSATNNYVGVASSSIDLTTWPGFDYVGYGFRTSTGQVYNNNGVIATISTATTNDVIGLALDMGAGTLAIYINNVSQGVVATALSGTLYAVWGGQGTSPSSTANFGATALTYSPPAGFSPGLFTTINDGAWPIGGMVGLGMLGGATQVTGTVYNSSLAEALTLADIYAAAATYGSSLSESVTGADAYAAALTVNGVLSESITAGDSRATVQVFSSALAETVTALDIGAPAATFIASLSDSVSLLDQYADSLDAGGNVYNETLAEALTLADALITSQSMANQVFETVALADSMTAVQAMISALSEAITLAAVEQGGAVYPATLAEAVTLSDGRTASLTINATLAEAITALDAMGATQVMISTRAEVVYLTATVRGSKIGITWPDPADVRAGVEYGPTGTEYIGTLSGGGAFLRRR